MNAVAKTNRSLKGFARRDGRKGIRNVVAVAYLVECAHHVSRLIVQKSGADDVHLIGFPGCYPNKYSLEMMQRLCTHPNVGAVLLVSLGCEGFNREQLRRTIAASGRPVDLLVIQQSGGTTRTLNAGLEIVRKMRAELAKQSTVPMGVDELIVGTVCGGSDGTSGITANPAVGRCFDWLIEAGAACIFEETGELIGCERIMASRAITPELGREIEACVDKAANYYRIMGYGSFAPGNAEGGLTTQEEKSLGAYAKSGSAPITGLLQPGVLPPHGGLYLIDDTSDGVPRHGFAQLNDSTKLAELAASGAHLILFSTGRGSVIGAAVTPVLKICANPETFRRMEDDMDVDAGRILDGAASLDEVGDEIVRAVLAIAGGGRTKSEALGHQEFVLTYKTYEPAGPACLPVAS